VSFGKLVLEGFNLIADHQPFEQLVFSGGGIRCFWYGGFLEAVRFPLSLDPQRISGVSGGALSAACFIADRGRSLLQNMGDAFDRTDYNLNALSDKDGNGLTPHQRIYREVVERTIDESAEQAIAAGPDFQILLAYPPSTRLPKWSTIPLTTAYIADLKIRSTPYLKFTRWAGLTSELVDAKKAAGDGKLVDLICNAAVIPPVFNLQGWNGKKVVDGGLACKAPMPEPDEGRTLIMLTRQFRNKPKHPSRVYAEVSHETPADKLDFTNRTELEQTWQMGCQDGKTFLEAEGYSQP